MSQHYDIIGDVHGHADELVRLLLEMGYQRHGHGFRHADRMVLFVGDLIDRGPSISDMIRIARSMVDAGDARVVMGNHEFNAIAFHTAVPGTENQWYREHSEKNRKQHQATLDQLPTRKLIDALAWFRTLPVTLELDGIRVVHAAWIEAGIREINSSLDKLGQFTPAFLTEALRSGSGLHTAVEDVLKGPELTLPAGHKIVDKSGHVRNTVRVKWYEPPAGRTYLGYHFGSDDVPDLAIDPSAVEGSVGYPVDAPPVLVGHYWLTGKPVPLSVNVACTDYSVAKNGKLVAYRWDGETVLSAQKFYWPGKG